MTTTTAGSQTTTAPVLPEPKPGRFAAVHGRFKRDGVTVTIVQITERRPRAAAKLDLYHVWPVAADFGRAFCWQKVTRQSKETPYHVNLAEEGGGETPGTCECMGASKANCTCRHIACSLRLIQNGSL